MKRISTGSEGEEVDCIDKKCYLVHQLRQICVITLPTNNTDCSIPCLTSGCDHETHRNIVCPIWLCEPHTTTSTTSTTSTTFSTTSTTLSTTEHTTTTTATSTTTSSSTTTAPPIPTSCHSVLLYLSVGLNVVLIVSFLVLLFYFLKIRKENRQFDEQIRRALQPQVNRFTGQVGMFSIDSIENLLEETDRLLAESDERQPLIQNRFQNMRRAAQVRELQTPGASNQSSVSDDTFLRHRSEYMFMSTFKPAQPSAPPNEQMDETQV
jgi:hypothetical protein